MSTNLHVTLYVDGYIFVVHVSIYVYEFVHCYALPVDVGFGDEIETTTKKLAKSRHSRHVMLEENKLIFGARCATTAMAAKTTNV